MAIDLLKHIASSPMPMHFRSPDDIEKVRILRAAGLVIAFVPQETGALTTRATRRDAEVYAVTQKGREALWKIS